MQATARANPLKKIWEGCEAPIEGSAVAAPNNNMQRAAFAPIHVMVSNTAA